MKKIIAILLLLVMSLTLMTSCTAIAGAFLIWAVVNQETSIVAENEFFDSENSLIEIMVDSENSGQRLDVFCFKAMSENILSRNYAQKLIATGKVTVETAAYQAGFRDLAYFYRVYRRLKGKKPLR